MNQIRAEWRLGFRIQEEFLVHKFRLGVCLVNAGGVIVSVGEDNGEVSIRFREFIQDNFGA